MTIGLVASSACGCGLTASEHPKATVHGWFLVLRWEIVATSGQHSILRLPTRPGRRPNLFGTPSRWTFRGADCRRTDPLMTSKRRKVGLAAPGWHATPLYVRILGAVARGRLLVCWLGSARGRAWRFPGKLVLRVLAHWRPPLDLVGDRAGADALSTGRPPDGAAGLACCCSIRWWRSASGWPWRT